MLHITFYSLAGKFAAIRQASFGTLAEAWSAVEQHIEGSGYTQLRTMMDADDYTLRYTATTPGGRRGRNVAICDFE